ncbi:MAG: branched-chain amino acid ABC transporter substrate-binding protein [Alphaproteobacteria bacterium HGW-Alphaproteobacteria-4]|jgi:branched-chain amino acid transport system substrate-binding protein|nr:MAG: branched-chain amino acid ABC transporter substrate-binding protein [Alphaproteobacteria bacterium HGW-Alphaproteobacteria-4]
MTSKIVIAVTAAMALAAPALAQDLKIGASLPMTGNFSVSGEKHQQGYALCANLLNADGGLLGRKIDLVVSDNRSDNATAISQYERFINVNAVEAVFGTFSSRLTFPVASILSRYGMVHPIPAGGALRIYTQGYEGLYYLQPNAAEYVGSSLRDMIRDRIAAADAPKTAVIVWADDFFANAVAAGFLGQQVMDPANGSLVADLAPGYLADSGIEVLMQQQWPEEGFNDWLNLANSIKNTKAELIIGLTASAEEASQLTRALQTVRADPKMVYLSQGTQSEYYEAVGNASNGVLVHTSWHPNAPFVGVLGSKPFSNADFIAAFQAEYGFMPDEDSAIPFAVCQTIAQAIEATGSTDNAKLDAWLGARTAAEPVKTILGDFVWDERGLPVGKPFLMAQWQNNGELNFVYPTNAFPGTADLVYPKNGWQ